MTAMAEGRMLLPTTAVAAQIGVLLTGGPTRPTYAALRAGLAALGYVEGKNTRIEARFAEGRLDRLPRLAAELEKSRVDVIAAIGAVHCRAALQVASGIPVVFAVVLDPVDVGLVAAAHRPGGNATGVTNFDPDGVREGLRLLKRIVPQLRRVAILGDAGVPDALPRASLAAARAEGLQAQLLLPREPEDLGCAFTVMRKARAEALVALGVPVVGTHGPQPPRWRGRRGCPPSSRGTGRSSDRCSLTARVLSRQCATWPG